MPGTPGNPAQAKLIPGASGKAAAPVSEVDKLYQDMMDKANSQWQVTEDLNMQSMAMMQRKAAAMQGAMGRSVAGGFAGAMGGAYVGGMNQLNQARLQHENALNALQLSYAQNKQSEANRSEDRSRAQEWRTQDQAREDTATSQADYESMDTQSKARKASMDDPADYNRAQALALSEWQAANGPNESPSAEELAQIILEKMTLMGYQPQF